MKRYIIGPQGEIGIHNHEWEHMLYILEGSGTITERDEHEEPRTSHMAMPGTAFYIPVGTRHSIKNPSLMKKLIFLSIIPFEFEAEEEKLESS